MALILVIAVVVSVEGIVHPPVVVKLVDAVNAEVDVQEQTVCTCHS